MDEIVREGEGREQREVGKRESKKRERGGGEERRDRETHDLPLLPLLEKR